MSTLWDRFQQAVEWLDTAATALSGIRTVAGAELGNFDEIVAATSGATAAPSSSTDGIDVEGRRTVDLAFKFSVAGETATVRVYLYDAAGDAWYSPESDKSLTLQSGESNLYIEPLDVETFDRIDVRIITAPSSGTLQILGSPNNE